MHNTSDLEILNICVRYQISQVGFIFLIIENIMKTKKKSIYENLLFNENIFQKVEHYPKDLAATNPKETDPFKSSNRLRWLT